jgi:hypothetical protein
MRSPAGNASAFRLGRFQAGGRVAWTEVVIEMVVPGLFLIHILNADDLTPFIVHSRVLLVLRRWFIYRYRIVTRYRKDADLAEQYRGPDAGTTQPPPPLVLCSANVPGTKETMYSQGNGDLCSAGIAESERSLGCDPQSPSGCSQRCPHGRGQCEASKVHRGTSHDV